MSRWPCSVRRPVGFRTQGRRCPVSEGLSSGTWLFNELLHCSFQEASDSLRQMQQLMRLMVGLPVWPDYVFVRMRSTRFPAQSCNRLQWIARSA